MSKDFFKRVYNIVSKIPKGKIATYGQIAFMLGEPRSARVVGWALRKVPDNMNIPCHRVVNKSGELSPDYVFGSSDIQRYLLKSEGIVFKKDGRINIEKYLWDGKWTFSIYLPYDCLFPYLNGLIMYISIKKCNIIFAMFFNSI